MSSSITIKKSFIYKNLNLKTIKDIFNYILEKKIYKKVLHIQQSLHYFINNCVFLIKVQLHLPPLLKNLIKYVTIRSIENNKYSLN